MAGRVAPLTGTTSGIPHGGFNPGPNPAIAQWSNEILIASELTGVPPHLIGAMIWAESRGNPNTFTTNSDGTTDIGLMQISQERWLNEIVPTLSEDDRARIKNATGLNPEQLDMNNPQHNLIGGAFEYRANLAKTGGNTEQALSLYVSGSPNGNPTYAANVLQYANELFNGSLLSQDPNGSP
jgi:soluble lytic murein transglycosylase-like protein